MVIVLDVKLIGQLLFSLHKQAFILPEKGSDYRDNQPLNSLFIILVNLVLLIGW